MTDKLHEAIVKAALERAADRLLGTVNREYGDHRDYRKAIRSLASDPAEVAAIIFAASQLNKERSDEGGRR
jgi:hypothetical protein